MQISATFLGRPDCRSGLRDQVWRRLIKCCHPQTTTHAQQQQLDYRDQNGSSSPSAGRASELSSRDDAWALSMDLKRTKPHNADHCHALKLFPRVDGNRLVVTDSLLSCAKYFSSVFFVLTLRWRPSFWMPCATFFSTSAPRCHFSLICLCF